MKIGRRRVSTVEHRVSSIEAVRGGAPIDYVGDGSLMYYDGVCENDPYRPGGARWDAVVAEAEDEGTESRLTC